MPRISTDNYDTVASWNGSQDLFIVEQPDGTKVATPAMVKQFIEAGDFAATGEITDGHGNVLADMAKSADVDSEIDDLIADFAVKTWTPKLYDYNTYKRDLPAQKYVKVNKLYVMFLEGTFDYSDISTMIQIRNLPCQTCVGGCIFLGSLREASLSKGIRIQGDGAAAYPRPNVISSDFGTASSAERNKIVLFGYDS